MCTNLLRHSAWGAAVALALTATVNAQQSPDAAGRNRSNQGQEANQNQAGQNRSQNRAQQQTTERRQAGEQGQAGQSGHLDGQLAACLIIGNQKEIALSQFGEQQTQNEDVKAFAQQLVQDHQQFVSKLEQIASQGGFSAEQLTVQAGAASTPAREGQQAQRGQRREGQQAQNQPQPSDQDRPNEAEGGAERRVARAGALDQTSSDMISIEREVAQACVETTQQALGEKQGADFDKAFISMQVHAHMGMQDKLQVFARHSSPELQAVLQEGLQTTEKHLQHAKELKEKLEGHASAEGRQQPDGQPQPRRQQQREPQPQNN